MNMQNLLKQARKNIQEQCQSIPAAEEYLNWIRRYLSFYNRRHPAIMGEAEVRQFLDHLEFRDRASGTMLYQAFCALNFLYQDVLGQELSLAPSVPRMDRDIDLLTHRTE